MQTKTNNIINHLFIKNIITIFKEVQINLFKFWVFVICILCYIKLVTTFFPIHICSLEVARESDLSIYDGVITIENTIIENPFRVQLECPRQLILRFDDISLPVDDYEEPREIHIYKSLQFADENGFIGSRTYFTAGSSIHQRKDTSSFSKNDYKSIERSLIKKIRSDINAIKGIQKKSHKKST